MIPGRSFRRCFAGFILTLTFDERNRAGYPLSDNSLKRLCYATHHWQVFIPAIIAFRACTAINGTALPMRTAPVH